MGGTLSDGRALRRRADSAPRTAPRLSSATSPTSCGVHVRGRSVQGGLKRGKRRQTQRKDYVNFSQLKACMHFGSGADPMNDLKPTCA